MEHRTLFLGDHVRYTGGKHSEINGKIGEIVGHVSNTSEVVVDFLGENFVFLPEDLKAASFNGGDEHFQRQLERKWKVSEENKGKKRGKDQEAK
jgi:hypothetical protein